MSDATDTDTPPSLFTKQFREAIEDAYYRGYLRGKHVESPDTKRKQTARSLAEEYVEQHFGEVTE